MPFRLRRTILCGLLLLPAAEAGDAARHIDLVRHYFATPEAEAADRKSLAAMLDRLAGMGGTATASPDALLAALALNDQVQASYGRHDAYLLLRCRMDSTDGTACADDDDLADAVDAKTAPAWRTIGALTADQLSADIAQAPGLAPYRPAIEAAMRNAAHNLSKADADAIAGFAHDINGWQFDLYRSVLGTLDFGTVATAQGPLDVRRQRNLIAVDPDPKVRAEGFRKRWAAYAQSRGTIAFALLRLARAGNDMAKAYGFANAPDRKYAALGLDPKAVRATIAAGARHGDLHRRFEKIRTREIAAAFKIEPGPWDMDVPLTAVPPLALDDVAPFFHNVFAGLGPWYQTAFDALLDPANGRFDALPGGGAHRSGNFSVGAAGATSALFIGTFDGTYKDLSVIAHEGGHAVHRGLMNEAHVLPLYTEGPHFLFEAFAEFNELVLADYMATHAANDASKRYYEERFLAVKGLDFLASADDAGLEQAIYDGAADGTLKKADDLDALTLTFDGRFSIWPATHPELKGRWEGEGMSLAYEDPLYTVNYLYAGMLALKYFQLYRDRPDWFVPRYEALLKNGFDDTPQNLLKRFLDIDLDSPTLLDDAVAVSDARLKALESMDTP